MQIETVPFRDSDPDLEPASRDETRACRLVGRFDAHESDQFRNYFDRAFERGLGIFIVDLSGVDFVDSTALAELVRAMKQLRHIGGDLVLRRPSNAVQIILELTKLNQAFTIETGV